MKSITKLTKITIVLMITLIANNLQTQTHEVGTLPGVVSVSPSGAATYAIPIYLPPGRAGMEPSLAFVYNSQGGNGLLGIGWSLSGLSGISRTGTTLYHDDFVDGVDFDDNDQFALDGMRLIEVDENGGNTEYRTEIETYSKIIAYGTVDDDPDWFEVYTKDGRVLQYGNSTDSRIEASGKQDALTWLVHVISDRNGNYIEYSYL